MKTWRTMLPSIELIDPFRINTKAKKGSNFLYIGKDCRPKYLGWPGTTVINTVSWAWRHIFNIKFRDISKLEPDIAKVKTSHTNTPTRRIKWAELWKNQVTINISIIMSQAISKKTKSDTFYRISSLMTWTIYFFTRIARKALQDKQDQKKNMNQYNLLSASK